MTTPLKSATEGRNLSPDQSSKPTHSNDPKGLSLSLEDQLAFYGAFHTQSTNVAIHLLFVPCIFFTALILLHALPSPTLYSLPLSLFSNISTTIHLTPSFLVAVGYASYFIALDPIAGGLYAPILLAFGHFSNVLQDRLKPAAILHVVSWIAQFVGHGVFEGRKPALFDALFQSIVLAVFFVWFELLFSLGYRPELHKRVKNKIAVAVMEFKRSQKKVA